MVTVVGVLGLTALGVALGWGAVATARNVQQVGDALVEMWVSNSRTATGRRKWSHGRWGSKKYADPQTRRQTGTVEGVACLVFLATGSLLSYAGAVALLRGG